MVNSGTDDSSRPTILSTILRSRPRGTSQSNIVLPTSSSPPSHPALLLTSSASPRNPGPLVTSLSQTNPPVGLGISHMLRRRRSACAVPAVPNPNTVTRPAPSQPSPTTSPLIRPTTSTSNSHHRIRLVPQLESRRSLRFDAISRDLREGDPPLRIGRFTDRSGLGLAAINALGSNKLAFKSKVVSRAHAEIWVEPAGFFIKDTKSSSGTFLNHVRLSPANTESRPHIIKDGDILQLGVDYQGGAEDIYKSVKIRIEVGREWQTTPNAFNTAAFKNLKSLALGHTTTSHLKSTTKSSIPDCCICLFAVTIRQALFIAPCSHTFHYKCIRPLIESHHPAFSCPLCRTFANLDEDVEVEPEADVEFDSELDPELARQIYSSELADPASSHPSATLTPNPTEPPSADHHHHHLPSIHVSSVLSSSPTAAALLVPSTAAADLLPDPNIRADSATAATSVPLVSVPAMIFDQETEREREGERDGGAETEVEGDVVASGSAIANSGRRRRRRSGGGGSGGLGWMGIGVLGDLGDPLRLGLEIFEEGEGSGAADEDEHQEIRRDRAVESSRRPTAGPSPDDGGDSSEGERSGVIDDAVDGDGTVVGKRKR